MSIDCRGESTSRACVPLEDWEAVVVLVPAQFPFEHPHVMVLHDRFADLPHVMWTDGICLYLSANDWDPGRGMHGFVVQLLTWFEAVAHGTITGPEIPWHAPLTYQQTDEYLMVQPDLPDSLEGNTDLWFALAVIGRSRDRLYELVRWLNLAEAEEPDVWQGRQELGDHLDGDQLFVAPVVALPRPVGFAYPNDRKELLHTLTQQGMPPTKYQELRQLAGALSAGKWASDVERPELLLLGSPAPDRYAVPSRIAHLAAWCLGADADPERVAWLNVFDQRPRVTTRRDATRAAQWLAGKRILVLGCGGLGAPAAEFCVRAGAAETHLVDDSEVRPGVLVRQPYMHADIGRNKATALAARLGNITPESRVPPWPLDAQAMITGDRPMPEVDLVIDATANRPVASALERMRWTSGRPQPPLLSMVVGHDCERGAATLALPGASGAGVDILRRLAITASADEDLHDVLDDFFPDHPRGTLFQPEPGCSDPTYVGSAADLATFAGQLLNDALAILTAAARADDAAFPQRWASVVRTSAAESARASRRTLQWSNDHVHRDRELQYQMRIDPAALTAMRREVVLMADKRGPHVETGGILLGQIDRASRVVWISEATGPPPGSDTHVAGFKLDPAQARGWAQRRRWLTRSMVAFIGAWHTHPNHQALPSGQDDDAMRKMARHGVPVLLMILGGGPDRLPRWIAGDQFPDMYLRLYFP
jgi:integrative and conjugative element protein (TIGR02256 family)